MTVLLQLQLYLHRSERTDISAAGAALYGFSPDFDIKEPFQVDDTYFPCEAAARIYHSPQLTAGDAHCQRCLAEQLNIRIEMPINVSAV